MRKTSLLALIAATLAACSDNLPTPQDFETIEQEIQISNTQEHPLTITAIGPAGDYLISLPESEALHKIYKKAKTVTFLSAQGSTEYIKEGTCLLNVIPEKVMLDMNMLGNKCYFRLFCGDEKDLGSEAYAVEVCTK